MTAETELTDREIAGRLQEKNIRPSAQRMAVYRYLAVYRNHPTVEAIHEALSPSIPTLSKTTVYNTLKQFVQEGLVQTVTIEDGELRYDADMSDHIHFKCTSCGGVYDIFSRTPVEDSFIPEGFIMHKAQTNIWGLCCSCAH